MLAVTLMAMADSAVVHRKGVHQLLTMTPLSQDVVPSSLPQVHSSSCGPVGEGEYGARFGMHEPVVRRMKVPTMHQLTRRKAGEQGIHCR